MILTNSNNSIICDFNYLDNIILKFVLEEKSRKNHYEICTEYFSKYTFKFACYLLKTGLSVGYLFKKGEKWGETSLS